MKIESLCLFVLCIDSEGKWKEQERPLANGPLGDMNFPWRPRIIYIVYSTQRACAKFP